MADERRSLTITIDRENVNAERNPGRGRSKPTKLKLDPVDLEAVRLLEDLLRSGRLEREEQVATLGKILYRAIFNGEVETFFNDTLKNLATGERLRLELEFVEDANEYATLPWEWLHALDGTDFLATKTNLVLTRYIPRGNADRPTLDLLAELKILVVVVQPDEILRTIPNEDKRKEIREGHQKIIEELRALAQQYPVTILDPLMDPTADELAEALKQDPHVVHYIGHGRTGVRAGYIALMQQNGRVDWRTSAQFSQVFQESQPKLVFLHLCQIPEPDLPEEYLLANFSQFAPDLIQAEINAVIAMRYPVPPEVAKKFTQAFYKSLVAGESLATAVQKGRQSLIFMTIASSRIASQVLYMNCDDGPILEVKPRPVEKPGVQAPLKAGGPNPLAGGAIPVPAGAQTPMNASGGDQYDFKANTPGLQ